MEVAFRINLYRGQDETVEIKDANDLNKDADDLNKDADDLNKDTNDLNKDADDLNNDTDDLNVDLETRLKEVIRQYPEMTYKALGETLAVSVTTIKRTMAKMQRDGKVFREGSNRKGKWILTNKK